MMENANSFLVSSGGAAVISALFIQYLKNSNWFTFLSKEARSQNANLVFSILVAFVTSLGISFTFNHVTGQFSIAGNVNDITTIMSHWVIQWVGQHIAYKGWVVPSELQAATVNVLKQLANNIENQNANSLAANQGAKKL